MNSTDSAKQREEIRQMVLVKRQPVRDTAEFMNIPEHRVRYHLKQIKKGLAKGFIDYGFDNYLAETIDAQYADINTIYHQLQKSSLGDSARSSLYKTLADLREKNLTYMRELNSLSQKAEAESLLERISKSTFIEFVEDIVGLPIHDKKKIRFALTPAQMKIVEALPTNEQTFLVENKARQGGSTTVLLLYLTWRLLGGDPRYVGKSVILQVGTNIETGYHLIEKLWKYLVKIGHVIKKSHQSLIEFENGSRFILTPASQGALNGWSSATVACVFCDEFALNLEGQKSDWWRSMLEPIANKGDTDLIFVSTPELPHSAFHRMCEGAKNGKNPKWKYLELPIDEMKKGGMYTDEEVKYILENDPDPERNYMCKFTSSKDSVLGTVDPEDFEDIFEAIPFD